MYSISFQPGKKPLMSLVMQYVNEKHDSNIIPIILKIDSKFTSKTLASTIEKLLNYPCFHCIENKSGFNEYKKSCKAFK